MPAIAKKSDKKKTDTGKKKKGSGVKLLTIRDFLWLAGFGCLLGLAAPGINQWYLVWLGLAPLILAITASKNVWQAALRGVVFGWFYNLVYLHWYLGLFPLDWLGFSAWQGYLLAGSAWFIVTLHQALIIGLFALLARLIPTTGSFIPQKIPGGWRIPCVIAMPLIWVLVINKIGNAHSALGVPWSMLEYTQYRQLPLIQVASIIGGIGIGFLIAMVNTQMASLIATLSGKPIYKPISATGKKTAILQTVAVLSLIPLAIAVGHYQPKFLPKANTSVSVLQGNINIDMQKTVHKYTLTELLDRYLKLTMRVPPGLCIWTESSVPTYLRDDKVTLSLLSEICKQRRLDMVIGSLDRENNNPYNGAYGITARGEFQQEAYHKRYLVPFGEYAPTLVQYMPEWVRRLTNTPAGKGLSSGQAAGVLDLVCGKVAPLICFECISPELACDSVRTGGQLLVNISDLAWFHRANIGEQMLAFSVFRAIETRRFFVFAANTGPTAIIDPLGRITSRSGLDEETVVSGRVGFSTELTPFAQWFR